MAFICFSLVSLSTQISFILGYFFLDIRNLDYLLFCLIFSSFLFLFFPIYLSVYLSILYTDGPCFNCLTIAGRGEKKRKKGKRKKNTRTFKFICLFFIHCFSRVGLLSLFLFLLSESFLHFTQNARIRMGIGITTKKKYNYNYN